MLLITADFQHEKLRLTEVFQAASQDLYQAQQAAQGAEGGQDAAGGADAGAEADDVTDVEFEEVEDKA